MNLNFENNIPIYIQLVEKIELDIISNKLKTGERLKSVRELAILYKVNPNTIQKALGELEEKGLIYTERTNGKFVTEDQKQINKIKDKILNEKINNFLQDIRYIGLTKKELIEYINKIEGE
ncbi:MAG TPA: GntR family transcriptional regulator [Bacilli bacterium]|nr:GntR family transcriptional regulator [Bacilli bacterium]